MTNSFLKYVLIASITPSSSGFLPTSLNMLWSPLRAHLYIFILIFLFYFFLLYNTALVLSYINMNPPQVYMSSQPWTPLPLPSPYHLSGSSQCTSHKHPVSCIEPRLAIHFLHDSIHVSMPFSQIIPPSPSPTESKSLFFSDMWESSKKLAICKAGKELSLELCQRFDLEPSSFQNYEKINACGLSYSVYAILTS